MVLCAILLPSVVVMVWECHAAEDLCASSWCNSEMCSTAQKKQSLKSLYLSEVSLLYLWAVCINHFELELSL